MPKELAEREGEVKSEKKLNIRFAKCCEKSTRKSIKMPLMENFTRQSVSHITLFHSLVLTLDLFWKTDKFIASRTTADGYRIDFNHDQRRSYLYRYTPTNIQRTENGTLTNRILNQSIWKWTCWTENTLPIENTLGKLRAESRESRMSGCYFGAWMLCQRDLITWVQCVLRLALVSNWC